MSLSKLSMATPVHATATHATSSVATITGVSGVSTYITNVSGSSDKSGALLLVKDGSTTIWQQVIGATAYREKLEPPLQVTAGANCSVTVDSTSIGTANINGVQG